MKKGISLIIVGALCLSLFGCSVGAKAPEAVVLEQSAFILNGVDTSLQLNAQVQGEEVSEDLLYSVADSSIAEVSEEGLLTAKGEGVTTVTVTSAVDENVQAMADVLVNKYTGVYTGEKYIDAMGTDVRISLELLDDGTFNYYRYPMNVAIEGGGQMPGMNETGTYSASGVEIHFMGETLSEFSAALQLNDGGMMELSGDMPTGGAETAMQLNQTSYEDKAESGTYAGVGETEDAKTYSFELDLDGGKYTLTATLDGGASFTASAGNYTFVDDVVEFFAEEGTTFNAKYDAERQVVEGTSIPAITEDTFNLLALTLEKQ